MLKIFLTADNHIGLKYASHEQASILSASRISAFENMVDTANAEKCDLFVIAGDLFENTYSITKKDISTLLDMLSVFEGTVVVLPGNHDYYDKECKLWQYFENIMSDKDNIMLLKDYRPYSIRVGEAEVILYPALCTSMHSAPGENNLGWIKDEHIIPDSAYRLGIAHGAVEGETIDREGQYFLMSRDELERIPVDAWLIGHTHVPFPHDLKENAYISGERIFNAGTHVQTDVSCGTEGYCFVIEIGEGQGVKPTSAKKVHTGTVHFYRKSVSVTAGEMENTLKQELAELSDNSVVDLLLSGAVSEEEYVQRHDILRDHLSRFIEGTYSDHALSKLISAELISKEFPETSFAAELLTALLDEPKEAQLAYDLLQSLKEGK